MKIQQKNEYKKNILVLITGTLIAQALPIAISPILTRIYTPEDFGVFSLYLSISTIFGLIANGRYEMAIMIPTKKIESIQIVSVSIVINFLFSIFLFIVILFFDNEITLALNKEEMKLWIYLIPISVFLIGLFNSLRLFSIRIKNYKGVQKSIIYKSLIMCSIQTFMGFMNFLSSGLIIGYFISLFSSNIRLLKVAINHGLLQFFNLKSLSITAKKYIDFIKFSVISSLANTSSQYLLNIIIPIYFNYSILGIYSLVQKVLSAPMSLISTSIGQALLQKMSEEKQKNGNLETIFIYTVSRLLFLSLLIFGTMYFYIEPLFEIIFGKDWSDAGKYAKILLPLFSIRFVVSPISLLFSFFEKQKEELVFNLLLLFIIIITIVFYKNSHFEKFLYSYTFFLFITYFLILLYFFFLIKKGGKNV